MARFIALLLAAPLACEGLTITFDVSEEREEAMTGVIR